MMGWMRGALPAVVTMVVLMPRSAKILARSAMGIMWPGDSNGKKKTWRSKELVILAGASAMNELKQSIGKPCRDTCEGLQRLGLRVKPQRSSGLSL